MTTEASVPLNVNMSLEEPFVRNSLLNIPVSDQINDIKWNKLNRKNRYQTLFWYSISWILTFIFHLFTYKKKYPNIFY